MSILKFPGGRFAVGDAANYLGKSKSWLDKQRSQGKGPRFLRVGGRIFYRQPDLDAFLDNCVHETDDTRLEINSSAECVNALRQLVV